MKHSFKKWTTSFLLVIGCSFATGCWDEVDIGAVVPVMAIGIDLTNDNRTVVYLEFPSYSTAQSGSSGSNSGEESAIISGTGTSFQAALDDAEHSASRKLFYPHNMLLLFSQNYAKARGIKDVITFAERSPFFRESQYIGITDESPEDVMKIKSTTEYMNAFQLRQLVAVASKSVKNSEIDVMNQLLGPSETTILAWFTSKEDNPVVDGAGIIQRGKLIRHLPPLETSDLLWAIANRKNEWLTFTASKSERTVLVIASQPKMSFNKRTHQVTIQIGGFAQLAGLDDGDKLDPLLSEELNAELNREVTTRTTRVIRRLQADGVDAIQVGKAIQTASPALWDTWKGNWADRFSKIDIHVDSQLRVVRNGMTKNQTFTYRENQKQGLME